MANYKGYLTDKDNNKIYPDNYDSGWLPLPLGEGMAGNSQYGFPDAQYRRINNIVYLKGLVMINDTTVDLIGTLPVGFRPKERAVYIIPWYTNTNIEIITFRIDITVDGKITINNHAYMVEKPTQLFLDGVIIYLD